MWIITCQRVHEQLIDFTDTLWTSFNNSIFIWPCVVLCLWVCVVLYLIKKMATVQKSPIDWYTWTMDWVFFFLFFLIHSFFLISSLSILRKLPSWIFYFLIHRSVASIFSSFFPFPYFNSSLCPSLFLFLFLFLFISWLYDAFFSSSSSHSCHSGVDLVTYICLHMISFYFTLLAFSFCGISFSFLHTSQPISILL